MFAIGFPRNNGVGAGPEELSISIANYETSDVNVTVTASGRFSFTDTISSGSATRAILPLSLMVLAFHERSKGILVEATGNVYVHGLSYSSISSDSYLALPCLAFSVNEYIYYEYFAISYDVLPSHPSVILVVACEDDTAIKLSTIGSTIMLNSMETLQVSNDMTDLTGTRITSSKPVSVMSGVDCTNVPITLDSCDHLVEQVPPTVTWGSKFFVGSLNGRRSNELIRVLSARNATVTVTCNRAVSVSMFQLTSGGYQTFEIPLQTFCSIKSTGPILVAQYAYGGSSDNLGDPFMMLIPPTEQYINKHIFQTFQSFHSGLNSQFTVYVTSEFYQSSDILINNTAISGWQIVPCSNEPACGYIARMTVSSGVYTIRHQNPSAIIGVSAYGFDFDTSYGMPVGMGLSPIQCDSNIFTGTLSNFSSLIRHLYTSKEVF